MTAYHRGYADRAALDGKPGDPIDFTASTPGVKRDGLDLRAQGWRLDNFRRSPVFQWCHDRSAPPLGRVEAAAGTALESRVFFDQEDPFARKVESKYRRGFLHAVSVGWDFVDAAGDKVDARHLSVSRIRDHLFYDLTELSGVPVPADPDALIQRQRAGLRSLSRQLAEIYDDVEDDESDVAAEDLRSAVIAELTRLGVPIPDPPDDAPALPEPAAPAGFFVPEIAARDLLAIFERTAA